MRVEGRTRGHVVSLVTRSVTRSRDLVERARCLHTKPQVGIFDAHNPRKARRGGISIVCLQENLPTFGKKMHTKWLQERQDGSKNDKEMPPRRASRRVLHGGASKGSSHGYPRHRHKGVLCVCVCGQVPAVRSYEQYIGNCVEISIARTQNVSTTSRVLNSLHCGRVGNSLQAFR